MGLVKSFLLCFSIFTTIPVPNIKWEEKYMKNMLFFLPFIGIVLGIVEYAVFIVSVKYDLSSILYAAFSTTLIILFTGGIHLDGYADTVDAVSCHGDMEKRKMILQDAHTGAFALIYTVIYILLVFAAFENMYKELELIMLITAFTISRIVVLILIFYTKPAAQSGLLYNFVKNNNKKVLIIYSMVFLSVLLFFYTYSMDSFSGVGLLFILILLTFYLRLYFNKTFGGISGDLAGFSICLYEAVSLLFISVIGG